MKETKGRGFPFPFTGRKPAVDDDTRRAVMVVDEKNPFIACQLAMQAREFIEHFSRDGDGWWYDARRDEVHLGEKLVEDADAIAFKAWCAANVVQRVPQGDFYANRPFVPPTEVVHEVMTLLARADKRDAVESYLRNLEGKWDGVRRLDEELPRALGIVADDDKAKAERLWVRKWLIGAVARALRPGCKMDTALLLVGPQGIGKSTSLAALFGEANVYDSALDFESKDGAAVMCRAWCVELAELASMRKARDVEAVKHFLSLREDTYRPSYGRILVTRPRRAVVAGTSNEATPLSDPTGNRRFWPVRALQRCQLDWLLAMRDVLWAEALAAYGAGEPWHLSGDEATTQADVAQGYVAQDEWVDILSAWLDTQHGTIALRDAAGALNIDEGRLDYTAQRRLASCLRACGMERYKSERGWRWRKIEG